MQNSIHPRNQLHILFSFLFGFDISYGTLVVHISRSLQPISVQPVLSVIDIGNAFVICTRETIHLNRQAMTMYCFDGHFIIQSYGKHIPCKSKSANGNFIILYFNVKVFVIESEALQLLSATLLNPHYANQILNNYLNILIEI